MTTKFTMTVDTLIFDRWEEKAKLLGIPRNSYITMMVSQGEGLFWTKLSSVQEDDTI